MTEFCEKTLDTIDVVDGCGNAYGITQTQRIAKYKTVDLREYEVVVGVVLETEGGGAVVSAVRG